MRIAKQYIMINDRWCTEVLLEVNLTALYDYTRLVLLFLASWVIVGTLVMTSWVWGVGCLLRAWSKEHRADRKEGEDV